MMNEENITGLDFVLPSADSHIIKVIGVGGGGGNAVDYMYRESIKDVSFVLCNTDEQALKKSPIPNKVLLGTGLGAGNRPERAKLAAEEAQSEIETMLDEKTRMVFVTATMGGGTGTGAAPVVARIAKEKDILTVGIVTIPFAWELGNKRIQAYKGVLEMRKNVDAILVIENEKLREVFPEITIKTGFDKVNEVLNQAAKGIAELITVPGHINLDFADVNTTLKDSGFALMNTGEGEGEHRILKALKDAVNSPLIQDTNVRRAKKILLNIYCSDIAQGETFDIDEFFKEISSDAEVIWGLTFDESLGEKVKITVIVAGFSSDIIPELSALEAGVPVEEICEKSKKPKEIINFTDLDDEARLEAIVNEPACKRR